jgi:membrane protein implicated in regulation of membrane protease activity
MEFNENIIFVILGSILIAFEIILGAVTGFELLILGIILMISGGIGYLAGSFMVTLGLASTLIFLYIFLGRKRLQSYLSVKTSKTNFDSLIGEKALVIDKISPDLVGKIKINGEVWRAESESLCVAGSWVKINSVSGVTLNVKPLN